MLVLQSSLKQVCSFSPLFHVDSQEQFDLANLIHPFQAVVICSGCSPHNVNNARLYIQLALEVTKIFLTLLLRI